MHLKWIVTVKPIDIEDEEFSVHHPWNLIMPLRRVNSSK